MDAVKIKTSWRIQLEDGSLVGFYMTEAQALRGIAKRIREGTPTREQQNHMLFAGYLPAHLRN